MESSFGNIYHFMNRYLLHSPIDPHLQYIPSVHVGALRFAPAQARRQLVCAEQSVLVELPSDRDRQSLVGFVAELARCHRRGCHVQQERPVIEGWGGKGKRIGAKSLSQFIITRNEFRQGR